MTNDKIRNLAIECGFLFVPNQRHPIILSSTIDELAAYTAQVEAPLQDDIQTLTDNLIKVNDSWEVTHKNTEKSLYAQLRIANDDLNQSQSKLDEAKARIAQLEAFVLTIAKCEGGMINGNIASTLANSILVESPSTWLSEHDKEVEARERERCAAMVDHILKEGGGTYGDAIRELK